MDKHDKKKIDTFLIDHKDKDFTSIGIKDESCGRFVRPQKVVNNFLVRHLKVILNLKSSAGEIGAYLYNQCRSQFTACDFWTTNDNQTRWHHEEAV